MFKILVIFVKLQYFFLAKVFNFFMFIVLKENRLDFLFLGEGEMGFIYFLFQKLY